MRLTPQQLSAALDAISETTSKAENAFDRSIYTDDEWDIGTAEWYVKTAYAQLRVLCEVLELPHLREEVVTALAQVAPDKLLATGSTPDGEPYLKHLAPANLIHRALQTVLATESSKTVTKDLEAIVRETTYAITDRAAFGDPPGSEDAVHRRIEAILRCMFPDLLHKPRLAKPIKNFEPDTGIPSINTLIEYKFIDNQGYVPTVADQILADTRGYTSKDWSSFLYVIYETDRFRPESQWKQLLRECGVPLSTSVVVLTGSATTRQEKKERRAKTIST